MSFSNFEASRVPEPKVRTPWGVADYIEEPADGITYYGTASHGGYHLSAERLAQVPAKWRTFAARWSHGWGPSWFEQDVAAAAVLVTFAAELGVTDEHVGRARLALDLGVTP